MRCTWMCSRWASSGGGVWVFVFVGWAFVVVGVCRVSYVVAMGEFERSEIFGVWQPD